MTVPKFQIVFKLVTYLLCCFIIFNSCKSTNKNNAINISDSNSNIVYDSICSLKENLDVLGNISGFNWIDNNHFIITTSSPEPALFVYNLEGEQEYKINRLGKGPGEYLEPTIVHVFQNHIYIWCSKQLKLIKLDSKGKFIEEYHGFQKAIKDFSLWNDDIIFYISGGFNESLIEIHPINQKENIYYFGKPSNEHLVLNLLERSGGLTLVNNCIHYICADELTIHSLNLENMNESSSSFKDHEFSVNKINSDAFTFINNERSKVMDYLFNNSTITNLFYADSCLIIQSEIGTSKIDNKKIDNSQRYLKYYGFNLSKEHLFSVKEKFNPGNNVQRYTNFNNKLYHIQASLKDETMNYTVYQIRFKKGKL